jgi:hypothetical protein
VAGFGGFTTTPRKFTPREIGPLVRLYLRANPQGASLAIFFQGGVDDADIRACLEYSDARSDTLGMQLARYLLAMTRFEREQALKERAA